MAKLNLSTATRDELVDLIRRQSAKVKELQNVAQLLEERDARLSSMELTVQLCKTELREEKASHSADQTAMQEQIQQLSQALVDAHERIASAEGKLASATASSSGSASGSPERGLRAVTDEAALGVLHGRIARLETLLAAKTAECEAHVRLRREQDARIAEFERCAKSAGDIKRLEGDLAQLREELEERCVELRGQRQLSAALTERVESLSQQLAAFELEGVTAATTAVVEQGPTGRPTQQAPHHHPHLAAAKGRAMPPRAASTTSVNTAAVLRATGSSSRLRLASSSSSSGGSSSSSSSTSSSRSSSRHDGASDGESGGRNRQHHQAQQQARLIGLDGTAVTAGTALFGASSSAATVSKLKKQVADLQLELRKRDETSAARSREEAASRVALQDRVKELQAQLQSSGQHQQQQQLPASVIISESNSGAAAASGVEGLDLAGQAAAIRRLVAFYRQHKTCKAAM